MKKIILALLTLNLLTACGMEVVDEGYRGIYTYNGAVKGEPLSPGLHFYNPFFADINEFAVREQKWEAETMAFTKDTQSVKITFAVTYFPDQKAVNQIYSQYGWEWAKTVVGQSVLSSIKDAVGQYTADSLVEKRDAATRAAESEIIKTLAPRHVTVTRLDLTNLDFDDQYEKAVEAKVTAVQHAIAEKNKTEQIKEQAKQRIEEAKAEAEAMRIKTQALSQNKALVQYEMVQKWNGELPKIILGGGSIPMIDMKSLTEK
jgi:regulator of protease activity HflC (stomatin/prohibitin superfamily)